MIGYRVPGNTSALRCGRILRRNGVSQIQISQYAIDQDSYTLSPG